jgi:hypothetical protein
MVSITQLSRRVLGYIGGDALDEERPKLPLGQPDPGRANQPVVGSARGEVVGFEAQY